MKFAFATIAQSTNLLSSGSLSINPQRKCASSITVFGARKMISHINLAIWGVVLVNYKVFVNAHDEEFLVFFRLMIRLPKEYLILFEVVH